MFDALLEIATPEEFHGDESVLIGEALFENVDHVRAVDLGNQLAFADESLQMFRIMGHGAIQDLDRDG